MTQEKDNQLNTDFTHFVAPHCEQTGKCLRNTAHKMLAGNGLPLVYRNGQRRQCHRVRPLRRTILRTDAVGKIQVGYLTPYT